MEGFYGYSLAAVLRDIRLFRIDMALETLLIVLGIYLYSILLKTIEGFIFPGLILPAIGIYLVIAEVFQ